MESCDLLLSGRKAPVWGLWVALWLMHAAGAVEARTWRVERDGSGDYGVIQDAVDVAASGDTIRIGPGRFTEYRTYVYSGNDWNVYANVRMGSLTVIGAGEGVTLIGPGAPGTWGLGANAVGLLYWPSGTGASLSVSALTFLDTNYGAYVQNGVFQFEQCAFLRVFRGVRPLASGVVRSCRFEGVTDFGVAGVSPATSLTIDACSFLNCGATFSVQLIAAVAVNNCDIRGCYSAGIFDRSAGTMRNCSVKDVPSGGYGLEVYGPGSYTIADNSFDGGGINIAFGLGADNVVCERNLFSGSRERAISITSCTPRLRDNHILKGEGAAVLVRGFPQPPDLTIDLTGNYWGTAIADSISAWIIDGNDPVVPPSLPIHGFVDFEPFSSVPVEAEKTSLGGVKALFR
ncbi:MAG: right-handed parallel beta-helix repeat-containing protein [Ahniella sp.]|nr:right-handed parallel beta-helix repeat-containing protein [Ahniella sp.]